MLCVGAAVLSHPHGIDLQTVTYVLTEQPNEGDHESHLTCMHPGSNILHSKFEVSCLYFVLGICKYCKLGCPHTRHDSVCIA